MHKDKHLLKFATPAEKKRSSKLEPLVLIHALPTAVLFVQHLDGEGVLLVTAHVSITHEVQSELVGTWRRCSELQLQLGVGLQRQPLDGQQTAQERWAVTS